MERIIVKSHPELHIRTAISLECNEDAVFIEEFFPFDGHNMGSIDVFYEQLDEFIAALEKIRESRK